MYAHSHALMHTHIQHTHASMRVRTHTLYLFAKAPLRVMYRKYSTRGGVEWHIQHEVKPSAVFA